MGVIEDDEEGGTGRFILEQVLGPTVAPASSAPLLTPDVARSSTVRPGGQVHFNGHVLYCDCVVDEHSNVEELLRIATMTCACC